MVERAAALLGVIAVAAVVVVGIAGVLDFTWYPRSESPWGTGPIVVASATAIAGIAWALSLRRRP